MPFKTRRRKVSAAERRFNFSTEGVSYMGPNQHDDAKTVQKTSKAVEVGGEYQHIMRDLVRIAIVVGLIVTLQFGLKLAGIQSLLF